MNLRPALRVARKRAVFTLSYQVIRFLREEAQWEEISRSELVEYIILEEIVRRRQAKLGTPPRYDVKHGDDLPD